MSLEDSVVGTEEELPQAVESDALDVAQDTQPPSDTEQPAPSEQESEDREPTSPLEAVEQGLAKLKGEQEPPADPQPEPEPEPEPIPEAAPEAERKDRIPAQEWQKLSPRTRETITRMRSERNQYRDGATRFEAIDGFMKEAGITGDQAGEALSLAAHVNAAMTGNAQSQELVLQALLPLVQQIQSLRGDAVLPEYQRFIDDGDMTESAAREASRVAAEKRAIEARLQQQAKAGQATEARQAEQTVTAIRSAIGEWEARTKETDPDYARKEALMMDVVRAMNVEKGPPRSPSEAQARLDDAYKKVSQVAGPSRAAVRPSPSSANTSPRASSAPQPRTALEALELGLARSRQSTHIRS